MYQSMRNWEFFAHEKEMLQQWQEFKHLPDDLNGFEGFSEGTSSPSWLIIAPLIFELFGGWFCNLSLYRFRKSW
jgi:hypothetical protein